VLSLPLLAVPPEYYKVPFRYATASITVTAFAMFIWALAKEGGGGPLLWDPSGFLGIDKVPKGSELGWKMILGISTQIGSICAGIMNQSGEFTILYVYSEHLTINLLQIILVLLADQETKSCPRLFACRSCLSLVRTIHILLNSFSNVFHSRTCRHYLYLMCGRVLP